MGWVSNAGGPPAGGGGVGLPSYNLNGEVLEDTTGALTFLASQVLAWQGLTRFSAPSDGKFLIVPSTGSNPVELMLGGSTSAFSMLKSSGTTVAVRLADDSADASITAANITLSGSASFTSATAQLVFGTDNTGSETFNQAIIIGNVLPATYALSGVGGATRVYGYNALMIGSGVSILTNGGTADSNIAIGAQAIIQTTPSALAVFRNTVIGCNGGAQGFRNNCYGNGANASGTQNISIGDYASAGDMYGPNVVTVSRSTLLGANANVQHSNSAAIGQSATTTAAHQIMLGTAAETVVHPGPSTFTGGVSFAAGSTSAPSGFIAGSATTGFYSAASNTFSVVANGVEAVRWAKDTGSFPIVGIGAVPVSGAALTVQSQGTGSGVACLLIKDSTGATTGQFRANGSIITPQVASSGSSLSGLAFALVNNNAGFYLPATATGGCAASGVEVFRWQKDTGAFGQVAFGATSFVSGQTVTIQAQDSAGASYPLALQNSGGTSIFSVASNGNVSLAGKFVPNAINTATYYRFDDYDSYISLNVNFSVSGTVFANANATGYPLTAINHPGLISIELTDASTKAYIASPINMYMVKSSTITYQWRMLFLFPSQLSTSGNRYVFNIGVFGIISAAPAAGAYLSYTDNVNSGNWVLVSNYANGNLTTTNTSTAVPSVSTWHNLTITLVNGVYTYILDGSTLGTVTDGNLPGGANWLAGGASIALFPSSYTANTFAFLDASDTLITGLTR
jgi:hypothetical protein